MSEQQERLQPAQSTAGALRARWRPVTTPGLLRAFDATLEAFSDPPAGTLALAHPLPYAVYIFDADSTLRECTVPGQPCPNQPGEWRLMPHVRETLAQYQWGNAHYFGIVSNQAGVALGYLDRLMAQRLLWDTADAAFQSAQTVTEEVPGIVRLCPHAPAARCWCRKPSPYMLLEIIADYGRHHPIARDQVLYVGDQPSDQDAAARAGVDFMFAWTFFNRPSPDLDDVVPPALPLEEIDDAP